MASSSTKHLTILLTDVKGFTEKTSHKSRAEILAMLEKNKELVLPVLENAGGKLVKTIGDAFLMSFESPTDAVLAGVAVQESLRAYNEDKTGADRIEVRVAINCGEVTIADNDVFGDPVNITARIESVAEAGEVFFTEAVYLSMNKTEVPSAEVGLLQLKGIPEKIRVYKVKREVSVGTASASAGVVASALKSSAKATVVSAASAALPRRPAALARRGGALLFDWMLCAMIFGVFGHQTGIIVNKKLGQPAKVQIVKDGVRVNTEDVDVNISPAGINISDLGDRSARRDVSRRAAGLTAFIWFLYQIVLLKRMSTTLGGKIFGLTVVRADGKPLEKHDRFLRAGVSVLSGWAVGLGYLWAFFDKHGRGWHDLAADTRVVDAA